MASVTGDNRWSRAQHGRNEAHHGSTHLLLGSTLLGHVHPLGADGSLRLRRLDEVNGGNVKTARAISFWLLAVAGGLVIAAVICFGPQFLIEVTQ